MSEQDFEKYENIEAARVAIDLFEDLGCKFACITTKQGGDISVVLCLILMEPIIAPLLFTIL